MTTSSRIRHSFCVTAVFIVSCISLLVFSPTWTYMRSAPLPAGSVQQFDRADFTPLRYDHCVGMNSTLFTVAAGMSHHMSNYHSLLQYLYFYQRNVSASATVALISPYLHLAAQHNHGRPLYNNFSLYYDIDQLTINGQPLPVVDQFGDAQTVEQRCEHVHLLNIPNQYQLIRLFPPILGARIKGVANPQLTFPLSRLVLDRAASVHAQLGGSAAAVHVRRGDKLAETGSCTTPARILQVLQSLTPSPRSVYIMSNERVEYFAPLYQPLHDSGIQLFYYSNFTALAAYAQADNFLLYGIENEVNHLAQHRISTFRTSGHFYDGYLCEQAGYQ